jgi:hypothetical protein
MKKYITHFLLLSLVIYFTVISFKLASSSVLSSDTQAYSDWYKDFENKNLLEVIKTNKDIGYSLLSSFFSKIGLPFSIYYTFLSLCIYLLLLGPFYRLSNRLSPLTYLAVSSSTMITMFHPDVLSHYLRQNIAQALVLNLFFLPAGPISFGFALAAPSIHFSTIYFVLLFLILKILPLPFNSLAPVERKKYLLILFAVGTYMGGIKFFNIVNYQYFLKPMMDVYFEWPVAIFWALSFLIFLAHQILNPEGFIITFYDRFVIFMVFTIWLILKFYYMDAYSVSIRWGHYFIFIGPLYLLANMKKEIPAPLIVVGLGFLWFFSNL